MEYPTQSARSAYFGARSAITEMRAQICIFYANVALMEIKYKIDREARVS